MDVSMLDELFNLDIKADIKYTPINTDKINKNMTKLTKNAMKSIFNKLTNDNKNTFIHKEKSILHNSDIYKKCKSEGLKYLSKCEGLTIEEVCNNVIIPKWFNDYWLDETNCKKYSKQQLKYIEKLFELHGDSSDICISIYCSILKEMLHGYNSDYMLQEKDIFKIKNRMRGI